MVPAAGGNGQRGRLQAAGLLRRLWHAAGRWIRSTPGRLIGGLVLAGSTWPVVAHSGGIGLDASFVAVLHLAERHGLRFGGDIVYAYGPLGYLGFPQPYIGATSIAAMGAYWLVHAAACVSLLVFALRAMPVALAVIVSYIAARMLGVLLMWDLVLVLWLFACAEILRREWSLRGSLTLAVLLPALASVALFGKFNVGLTAFAMATITALVVSRGRRAPVVVLLGSAVIAPVIVWMAAGQMSADLPAFLRYSFEIAAGYSSAMGIGGTPETTWQYAAAATVVGAFAWLTFRSTSLLPPMRRLAFLMVAAGFWFATLKAGFVRFDSHSNLVFATAVLAMFAVLPPKPFRSTTLLALAVAFTALLGAARLPYTHFLQPTAPAEQFIGQIGVIWDPARRAGAARATTESVRAQLPISPELMWPLAGRTFHIDPDEASVILAYPDVIWRPPPVFQPFSAFTPALDELNAEFFRSERAPDVVLRLGPHAIDGRWFWWESPAAMLEVVCHYVQSDEVAVFHRTDNRCGTPEHLGTRIAAHGEPVPIPSPTSLRGVVFARVELDRPVLDRVSTMLFRGDEWFAVFDGARQFRLVPATASGPLILSVPATLGWTSPWTDGMPQGTLSIAPASGSDPEAEVTIHFYEVRLSSVLRAHP